MLSSALFDAVPAVSRIVKPSLPGGGGSQPAPRRFLFRPTAPFNQKPNPQLNAAIATRFAPSGTMAETSASLRPSLAVQLTSASPVPSSGLVHPPFALG